MIVLLDRQGMESALPDMPAGMVMFLVPTDMGRQQPVNPPADVPIVPSKPKKKSDTMMAPENPSPAIDDGAAQR
jgi:hypothetical protein